MTAIEFAWYIVNKHSGKAVDGLSPMKLQKLLYFTHVWSVVSGEMVVDMAFEKWPYGPVHPEVYHAFKKFGSSAIPPSDAIITLPEEEELFTDFVIENYIKFSALTLSALTHSDAPWQKTLESAIISDVEIFNYYSGMSFAKNFPVNFEKPYYPVETDLHYSFILDVKNPTPHAYPSYLAYKELEIQSKKDFSEFLNKILAF